MGGCAITRRISSFSGRLVSKARGWEGEFQSHLPIQVSLPVVVVNFDLGPLRRLVGAKVWQATALGVSVLLRARGPGTHERRVSASKDALGCMRQGMRAL